jgi:RNA polymerase sigma factor (sigma-70 family)
MTPTHSFTNNRVQILAREFNEKRNDRAFTPLFNEIHKITSIKISGILKNDSGLIGDISNKIAMKIWDDKSTYSEDKSIASFIMVCAENYAKMYLRAKKSKKEILASDMIISGSDDESSIDKFDILVSESYVEDSYEESFVPLHESEEKQLQFVIDKMKEIYKDEEYEMVYKSVILGLSPVEIAEQHNIASRGTISSKGTRARQKIANLLNEEITLSKRKENKTVPMKLAEMYSEY